MPMTVRDGYDDDAESQDFDSNAAVCSDTTGAVSDTEIEDFDSNGIIVRASKDILDALSSLEGMRF